MTEKPADFAPANASEVRETLDGVVIESFLADTSRNDDRKTIEKIMRKGEELPIQEYYLDEIREPARRRDANDIESRMQDRLHEHLFCQFFRVRNRSWKRGQDYQEATDRAQAVLVKTLRRAFQRPEAEIPACDWVQRIAGAFRKQPEYQAALTETADLEE